MAKKTIICYHWTGGGYKPNATDLNSYQILVGGMGDVHLGTNPNPSSIAGLNSITYNIALCSMLGAAESMCKKGNYGDYPITRIQLEKAWYLGAEAMKKYGIPVNMIFTHSCIGELCSTGNITTTLGVKPNKWLIGNVGKWDIDYLKDYPHLDRKGILDLFRNKIQWYYKNKVNK